ncbi:MAG: energy-coupling factor transporter transmembrane protein EcfT [Clostridia bacterium]|nr:energy-coupling factor transporter transmembrane protein EcfT [Clostridia bacterium]
MLRDVTFGQYYPKNSFVHRMDARVKILLMILYIVTIFLVQTYSGYIATAFVLITTIVVARIPLKTVLKSVKAVIFLVLFTAILNILFYQGESTTVVFSWWIIKVTDGGLLFAMQMAFRLIFLVMGTSLLTFTTTPVELTDGIESLLSPLKLIRVPVHDIAVIMSITLRFIPILMEETDKIIMAQSSRGADFSSGGIIKRAKALLPVLIPLFISAFRRADELSLAMDSRCYGAPVKRTKHKVRRISVRDIIGSIFYLAYLAFIIVDNSLLLLLI